MHGFQCIYIQIRIYLVQLFLLFLCFSLAQRTIHPRLCDASVFAGSWLIFILERLLELSLLTLLFTPVLSCFLLYIRYSCFLLYSSWITSFVARDFITQPFFLSFCLILILISLKNTSIISCILRIYSIEFEKVINFEMVLLIFYTNVQKNSYLSH